MKLRKKGDPGLPGPDLPPGWCWVAGFGDQPPHRAECEHADLVVKVAWEPRARRAGLFPGWSAWVDGFRLRQKDGVVVLARGLPAGTRPSERGAPIVFGSPWNAANAALAYLTHACLAPRP